MASVEGFYSQLLLHKCVDIWESAQVCKNGFYLSGNVRGFVLQDILETLHQYARKDLILQDLDKMMFKFERDRMNSYTA